MSREAVILGPAFAAFRRRLRFEGRRILASEPTLPGIPAEILRQLAELRAQVNELERRVRQLENS